ncbi:MAG TPA: HD domain-containing protein [Gemmatimonadaceae bacterium]
MTHLTGRFVEAVRYAADVHGDQLRKGTEVPYVSHLLAVASFVLDDGGGEDEAIAALLHDAAEDQGGRARLEDIRSRFGDTVAHIVEGCTDNWTNPKEPWNVRKARYAEHAKTIDRETLRVSAADKVHNAYGILRDLRTHGEAVWKRFSAPPDDIISYYDQMVRSFRQAGGGELVDELERVVRGIKREMGY